MRRSAGSFTMRYSSMMLRQLFADWFSAGLTMVFRPPDQRDEANPRRRVLYSRANHLDRPHLSPSDQHIISGHAGRVLWLVFSPWIHCEVCLAYGDAECRPSRRAFRQAPRPTKIGIGNVHLDQLPGSFFGPSTLVELLQHRASHQSDIIGFRFFVDGESTAVEWTYADLDRKARAIAATLQSNGDGRRAGPAALSFGGSISMPRSLAASMRA